MFLLRKSKKQGMHPLHLRGGGGGGGGENFRKVFAGWDGGSEGFYFGGGDNFVGEDHVILK